ncbi:MAG: hypothetical protein IPK60_09995 [Sandaracinaceae bacterium]|nr:hypothetical protein [Sandaracinaceae bacterium]
MLPRDADELLTKLIKLCPPFASAWARDAYLWTDDTGATTFHGVFAGLSHHVVERLALAPAAELKPLFELVEEILIADRDRDEPLGNAAATCFLENVVGDSVPDADLLPLLGTESTKYCKLYGLTTT